MNTLSAAHPDPGLLAREGPALLSIVIPVFNEEAAIRPFLEACALALGGARAGGLNVEYVFVNDGSEDQTLSALLAISARDPAIVVVDLSRNFGKEAALSAGLATAAGNAVVPIDVDLQDPPHLIPEMIERWREGWDVVIARRSDRSADSLMKRSSARLFYRIHNLISEPQIPADAGDFRLMDRTVVDALNCLPESRRFMKGLFAWAGFRTTEVRFARSPRQQGESHFNGWRLWNLALEGVTSFSTLPLRIWTYVGLIMSTLAFSFALFLIVRVVLHGIDVPGYASLMVAVMLLGGLQLLGIGILGEYLGRTYIESKRRPVYVVRQTYRKGR